MIPCNYDSSIFHLQTCTSNSINESKKEVHPIHSILLTFMGSIMSAPDQSFVCTAWGVACRVINILERFVLVNYIYGVFNSKLKQVSKLDSLRTIHRAPNPNFLNFICLFLEKKKKKKIEREECYIESCAVKANNPTWGQEWMSFNYSKAHIMYVTVEQGYSSSDCVFWPQETRLSISWAPIGPKKDR